MSDRVTASCLCAGCGTQLDPTDAPTTPYCAQCAAERAERDLAAEQSARASNAPDGREHARTMRRLRTAGLWALGLAAVIIIIWRAPTVFSAVQPPKPIRIGAQSASDGADACIDNLWKASADLSEGRAPAAGLACPASGQPYVVVVKEGVTVVSCPTPAKHGLEALSVDSVTRVPVAK